MLNVRTLAVMALLASAAPTLAAEDWPRWMGPRGDNISKESVSTNWPGGAPKRLWEARVGQGHSSPIAHDGKVYLFMLDGNEEVLTCFDARTGTVHWRQGYGVQWKAEYPGTRATPTIDGDRLYTLGEAGDLICRELADGKELWRTNVCQETGSKPRNWGCASSPLIVGDRIYVQTGEGGPIAVAVNKETGKIDWKAADTSKAGFASLVYADVKGRPQIILFAGRALGGLDAETGKLIWSEGFETSYDVNAATPIYHDGHVLFTAEYPTGRARLYALNAKGARKVWENKNLKSKFQPPILDDGFVYANSGGNLVCVEWKTGRLAWQAKDRNLDLKAGGSLIRAGGDKLITMSERGTLSVVQATPKGYKLLAQTPLFDAREVWSTPLLYDGKLYCKGGNEFVCLDVAAE
jgi:outer membrane protein assembly factor BamB